MSWSVAYPPVAPAAARRGQLDSLGSKFDKVSAEVEGSVEKAAQADAARGKIRTVLGSQTMMVAELK